MSHLTAKRSACVGGPKNAADGGCQRCRFAHVPHAALSQAPNAPVYLLLGAPDGNARQALVNALEAANTPYSAWGQVLAVPTLRERVTGMTALFLASLPDAAAADVKGTFFSGDLSDPAQALSAFVRAEPLAALAERAQHDWVRDALDDWLFSVFHPIVEARSGQVFAYEALIRARNPKTQEVIGAGPLINASLKLNIEHVLDQRARQTAIREAAALSIPKMRVFINFMPNTIYDPEVCLRTTMEAVEECGMALSDLVFEVVETENIPDMKRLRVIPDDYRARGAGTAVDDIGAGFSSLEYLTALRPDYVKLDRDLIGRAQTQASARQSLDIIVAQAAALDIKVIAEGIETNGQRQMGLSAGVDYVQGYLFGLPANPPPAVPSQAIPSQATPPLRLLAA